MKPIILTAHFVMLALAQSTSAQTTAEELRPVSVRMAEGLAANAAFRRAHPELVVASEGARNLANPGEDPCYIKGYIGGLPYYLHRPGSNCPVDDKHEGRDCSGFLRPQCQ